MTKGKKFVIALAVLVAVALISGLTTLAVTNYGTESDPLVTLSYLNETLSPQIEGKVSAAIDAKARELEDKFDEAIDDVDTDVSTVTPAAFKVVTLSRGQTVTCSVGTEIMLRVGSASSYGSNSPRLIDETGGGSVTASGVSLTTNHMYMVTIEGNGITANASTVKVLIRGSYTVA